MSNTFTPKNHPDLVIPLMNLKGNPYMKVAYRVQWFELDQKHYEVESEALSLVPDVSATVKVTVRVLDANGKVIRKVSATKAESRKDFADFYEKAETGAFGRALAMLGYGTAQAVADLDEGDRIVDSPLPATRPVTVAVKAVPNGAVTTVSAEIAKIPSTPSKKPSSFRQPKAAVADAIPTTPVVVTATGSDEWGS